MNDSSPAAVSERAAALWRAYLAGLPPDYPHRTARITEFSFGDSPASSATARRPRRVESATPPAGYGTLIRLPVSRQSTVDTAELLRELRIDRDGRPTRNRRRLVLGLIALVIVVAAVWVAWSRFSVPTVRTVAARAATPAGGPAS